MRISRYGLPSAVTSIIAFGALQGESAQAAGFALLEQSASRLGTAFAGTAAAADDVSTVFFNPAGLTQLEGSHASIVASAIEITSEFHIGAGSVAAFGQPLGNDGGDAGDWNYVPSAYLSTRINEKLALGLGVNAPFGLKLEYAPGWVGRFQALNSEIETINVNPSIAYQVNDRLSIGLGANYQRIQAELTNAVNYFAVAFQGAIQLINAGQLPAQALVPLTNSTSGAEGHAQVRGDDSAWGFNFGLLFDLSDRTRLGLSYRSSIDYEVEGSVSFTPPQLTDPVASAVIASASAPGGPLSNGPASVDLELPDTATVSLRHFIGDDIELLADIAWTRWSSVQELVVVRDTGATVSETPELWDDTWRFALGGTYRLNDALKLRAGLAFDQTPVPDSTRTPRLPDEDRTWIALGVQWAMNEALTFDAGYAHLFSEDAALRQNAGNTVLNGVLVGEQTSDVDVLSVQVSYQF